MKIRTPNKGYDPVSLSNSINEFWESTYSYKRTKKSRRDGKPFYFVDGPPFTSDEFHLGLARNKILKDSILRFKRAQGFNVLDRPGYDMHGLPIEVKVEETLGIRNRKDIEELGLERFVESCNDYAEDFKNRLTENFRRLGIWMDWENAFLTTDPSYIESVWWSIKEAHSNDLLRKTNLVIGWCTRCESPLTQGEIVYKSKQGHSSYIKIPIKGRRDEYIVVWTTTPWTFTGALAVAVNPDLDYARVAIRQGGRKSVIIVLESRVEEIAEKVSIEAYEIIDTVKGYELEGLEFFHPLMADIQFHKGVEAEKAHTIITLESVHDSHTGAVYISPGFGTFDYDVGMKLNIPIFSPIDERGMFTTEAGMKYATHDTAEVSNAVIQDLRNIRFLLHDSMVQHTFGHCWRCHSPVIYRATKQWILRVNDVKDIMLKTIKGTNWIPEKNMELQQDWIRKSNDWCISRQRYWGTPLPIWECITDVCGHVEIIDSLDYIKQATSLEKSLDLHRPWIDDISLECPKCGGLMKRVQDIIDVWFDSSVASWAQLAYPRKKTPFNDNWPSELIIEGQEQTKGWFHNQMTSGVMMFRKVPFKTALVHGKVLDRDGHSIVESQDEDSDPDQALGLYGPDALRLYFLEHKPWEDITFDTNELKRYHGALNILWNSYVFASTYMSMDSYDPSEHQFKKLRKDLRPEDQWILSRTESLTNNMLRSLNENRPDMACQHIEEFIVNDLSRWYIRIIRERIWEEGLSKDKLTAFMTLHRVLTRLSIVSSPIIPYISERIYQELDGTELSVSMVPWPETDASMLAEGMEKNMRYARTIVNTANILRQESGLQLRWPVRKMTISATNEEVADAVNLYRDVICRQTNVKELELVPGNQEWAGQELLVIPNPNVIGKAYKQWESKIARMLKVLPAREIKEKIETGEYTLGIEGQVIRILPSMVQFETKLPEGVVKMDFPHGVMYLDTTIDDELLSEGFARQIIRRIQEMRKEMELDPEEYVRLSVSMSDSLIELIDVHLERIADSTRAKEMEIVEEVGDEEYVVEWPIEEETIVIGVTSLDIKKSMDEFTGIKEVTGELVHTMVEAGITDKEAFFSTDREVLLKIPGMTHSTLRKIKEHLETPQELRQPEDQRCPLCDGIVQPGATNCHRCGKNLVGNDDMDIQLIGEFEVDEEEDIFAGEVEEVKEKVKIKKEPRKEEKAPEPEDEIVKMVTGEEDEPTPEDLITSEIMGSISEEEPSAPGMETEVEGEDIPDVPVTDETPVGVPTEEASLHEEEELTEPDEKAAESDDKEVATKKDIIDSDMDKSIDAMADAFEIKHSIARELYKKGFNTIDAIEVATEEDLKEIKGVGKVTARRIKQKLSEHETKMCSLCNAIVPSDSRVCDRCGVAFVSGEDIEDDEEREEDTRKEDAKLLRAKALTLSDAGKHQEALEIIDEALGLDPDNERLQDDRTRLTGEVDKQSTPQEAVGQTTEEAVDGEEQEDVPDVKGEDEETEEPQEDEENIKLRRSFTYLVPEERSAKTYGLFKQKIDTGMPGFCVTRTYPEKVRERYQIGDTPVLWLSNVAKEDAVRPKDLEKLSLSLEEFLSSQGGIVLLDGIEYLITNNNFITVLKLIQSLRDQVAINRSILLLSINPSTMDSHQINLLRREVDTVIE